jgi:hypothetical protein
LTAEKIHQNYDTGPNLFGVEGNSGDWGLNFGDEADGWLQHVQDFGSLFLFAHGFV